LTICLNLSIIYILKVEKETKEKSQTLLSDPLTFIVREKLQALSRGEQYKDEKYLD